MFRTRRQRRYLLPTGICLLLASGPVVAQQSDDYLRQLDEEAGDLSLDRKTRNEDRIEKNMRSATGLAEVPVDEADKARVLDGGLSREDFESMLRKNYFGSYSFYRRLNEENRARIHQRYLQDADPVKLRKAILESLKRQRGKP